MWVLFLFVNISEGPLPQMSVNGVNSSSAQGTRSSGDEGVRGQQVSLVTIM